MESPTNLFQLVCLPKLQSTTVYSVCFPYSKYLLNQGYEV